MEKIGNKKGMVVFCNSVKFLNYKELKLHFVFDQGGNAAVLFSFSLLFVIITHTAEDFLEVGPAAATRNGEKPSGKTGGK